MEDTKRFALIMVVGFIAFGYMCYQEELTKRTCIQHRGEWVQGKCELR